MSRHRAKFVKLSICPCGFPILSDNVAVGALYVVETEKAKTFTMQCGGCKRRLTGAWVWAEPRAASDAGYLPLEIFEIDEGVTA